MVSNHWVGYETSEDAAFTIGPYTFRPGSKMLLLNPRGSKVRLTEKEISILRYLYSAGQRPVISGETVAGGPGLQVGSHHPHAGDAHLSIAAKD
jgi:hypothetical protein